MSSRQAHTALAAAAALASLWFSAAPAPAQGRQPDLKRGAVIAAQGTANVPACAQCHAFSGASDSSGAFPMLADQSASYLLKQMRDFASAERMNAIMSPIAKALSAEDAANVTAFYAANPGQFLPLAAADPALVEKGKRLARSGNAAKGIQACNNCHGPDGAGIPPAIPYLAGQYAQYIAFELQMWKRGFRKNSRDTMAPIARQLDDADIAAVAAFYQQIRGGTAVVAK